MVEYFIYILVALSFATLSSYLTVRFTKSTDFESRKNVNVTDAEGNAKAAGGAERKVMYFAAGSGKLRLPSVSRLEQFRTRAADC
jgi:hypothetical protein